MCPVQHRWVRFSHLKLQLIMIMMLCVCRWAQASMHQTQVLPAVKRVQTARSQVRLGSECISERARKAGTRRFSGTCRLHFVSTGLFLAQRSLTMRPVRHRWDWQCSQYEFSWIAGTYSPAEGATTCQPCPDGMIAGELDEANQWPCARMTDRRLARSGNLHFLPTRAVCTPGSFEVYTLRRRWDSEDVSVVFVRKHHNCAHMHHDIRVRRPASQFHWMPALCDGSRSR